jgi:hypothetical protein
MRLALVLLAACDGTFGLVRLPDPPRDATSKDGVQSDDSGNVDARLGCFFDTFSNGDDGLLANWDRTVDPTATAAVQNGKLVITLAPNVNNYARVNTNRTYDMTGGSVSVRVDSVVGDGTTETFVGMRVDDTNFYFFDYVPGYLGMRMRVNNVEMHGYSIQYDAVAHRYWRMKHEPPVMRYLTSVDGANWTSRHTIPLDVPVVAMTIRLAAGAYGTGAPDPGGSTFDDVEICTQ